MTDRGLTSLGRTFSCRIEGRAGYVRLRDDCLELIRSGRRGSKAPEVVPLYSINQIVTGKPGRLFTAIQVGTADRNVELAFPSVDAPRLADLIATLAEAAVPPAPPAPRTPAPPAPPTPAPPTPAPPAAAPGIFAPPQPVPAPVEVPEIEVPAVEMVWVPLPESTEPDGASDPVPAQSVFTPAAAPAVEETPAVAAAPAVEETPAVAAAPSVEEARAVEETPEPRPERPADIPPDIAHRLSRLEVLHTSGIMSDDVFLEAEAQIFELVRKDPESA